MEKRPKRVFAAMEVVVGSLIWLINLYRLPTHLAHTNLMDAASSVMILLFCPALVWQALQRFRTATQS